MRSMLKKLFWRATNHILKRQQIIRLSRFLMNIALGDNNDDIKTNRELFLLGQVLDSIQRDHEFVIFNVRANVGQWTTSLLDIARKHGADKVAVHCFEPASFTFSKLQATLAKHQWRGRCML